MADYPDIETALLDVLERDVPALEPTTARHVDTEAPPDLQDVLPFVRVTLVTGRDDGVTDYSVVDLDVFANSRATAYALAMDLRSRLTAGPHRVGQVVLDRIRTEEKPRRLPWDDENIWRLGATYRISARR